VQAARTPIYRYVTVPLIVLTSFVSIARVLALQHYFRSPMPILFHLQYTELPTLAIHTYPTHYPKLNMTNYQDAEEQMDISILSQMNLTLCYGKEWYRFPSSFLVPDELRTEFVKSDFDGILPKHFVERRDAVAAVRRSYVRSKAEITRQSPAGFNNINREEPDRYVSAADLLDLGFTISRSYSQSLLAGPC
jgi:alpha-1,2-mannosyltransferase